MSPGPARRRSAAGVRRASAATVAARAAAVPTITYPDELPVSQRRDDIAAAIRDHQVVIVAGETGSGKTTQIPKICLDLGRGIAGTIGHTQPRRIAARTVAERIAEELGVPLGGAVGYQVRFTDQVSRTTLVKLMTDGILLAEIQRDPLLEHYDTLIVDEAHERSLNIDFILGYLANLLPRRPDLKVIITSATIDSARFAAHFGAPGTPAPVVEVTGRTYPVEVRYRPLVPEDDRPEEDDGAPPPSVSAERGVSRPIRRNDQTNPAFGGPGEPLDQTTAICRAVDELMREGPGDVLVFLSGEREIRDTAEGLREHLGPRFTAPGVKNPLPGAVEVLPLYARLSSTEQHRVFEPHALRRIVLATNVAETSLTVPGIRYVVDPGTARISRYSNRTKVQRLPIEPVSQASANQRAGRCGRVADGIAIRLYSRRDFDSRPEFTEPEILRTSLASVILQMTALGLGEVAEFPFVDPPDPRAVRDGLQLLVELGAIDTRPAAPAPHPPNASLVGPNGAVGRGTMRSAGGGGAGAGRSGRRLTAVGSALAHLPIDPRLGRMLVEAGRLGVVREVMIIVAGLSVQDVRERPSDAQQAADEKHRRFADPTSDFLAFLSLWEYLREQQRDLSSSAFRRLCRAEYLHWLRVREWQDVHEQLRQLAKPLGLTMNPHRPAGDVDADTVHRALLAGLLSHVGMWDERKRDYLGARGSRFVIFPGSGLAKKPPAWVMAAELVETSRLFARTVARITPDWVEPLAEHLVRRTYAEPRWSGRQGAALVTEKVLLYGIPIVAGRPAPLGRIDPEAAREMFIRNALVEGDWRTHHRFFAENRALLEEAEDLEHRVRRRDIVISPDGLFDFYDERLPESIVSARHFDTWWKGERRRRPDLLTFTLDMLAPEAAGVDAAAFPLVWRQGDLTLPLTYQFAPGTDADGVTVHVPLAVLPRLRPDGFDWMVPGLVEELTVATIRALPKVVRVQLVPAPDVARAVVGLLPAWGDVAPAPAGAPSFHQAFASAVREARGVVVPEEAFDDERLPPHLRMTFRAVGERGDVVDEGKSLVALQRRLAPRAAEAVRAAVRGAVRAAAGHAPAGHTPAGHAPLRGTSVTNGVTEPPRNALERSGLWTFPADLPGGRIPEVIETVGADGHLVRGFPALVAERLGTADVAGAARPSGAGAGVRSADVALRVLTTQAEAAAAHPAGVRRLLVLDLGLAAGRVTSRWTGTEALTLAASPYPTTDALVEDVQAAAITRLTAGEDLMLVRDAGAYGALATRVRTGLEDEVHAVVAEVVRALTASRELDAAIRGTTSLALLATASDVRAQHSRLVYPGFVAATPSDRLRHLPRYLRATTARLAKAVDAPTRDADLARRVRDLEEALAASRTAIDAGPIDPARLARAEEVRWLIEELRVSFFAQHLGTPVPVSEKRIAKALAAI